MELVKKNARSNPPEPISAITNIVCLQKCSKWAIVLYKCEVLYKWQICKFFPRRMGALRQQRRPLPAPPPKHFHSMNGITPTPASTPKPASICNTFISTFISNTCIHLINPAPASIPSTPSPHAVPALLLHPRQHSHSFPFHSCILS